MSLTLRYALSLSAAINTKGSNGLKKMPTDQAIIRMINRDALSGKSRSQKLAVDLMLASENRKRDERNARFQVVADYKARWEIDSGLRKQRGELDPTVYPHPDHLLLDYETGEVTYVG